MEKNVLGKKRKTQKQVESFPWFTAMMRSVVPAGARSLISGTELLLKESGWGTEAYEGTAIDMQ